MSDKTSIQDHNDGLQPHWKALKEKKFQASFPETSKWIRDNAKSQRRQRKSLKRAKLALAAVIAVLFVISSVYKVETKEKFADLISFNLDTKNNFSFNGLSALQSQLGFSVHEIFPSSFVSLVRKNGGKVRNQLSSLEGIRNLQSTAIEYIVRESLLNRFIHTTLKLGTVPKPKKADLKIAVQQELEKKGISSFDFDLDIENDNVLVISNKMRENTSRDSLIITSNLPDTPTTQKNVVTKDKKKTTIVKKLENFEWLLGTWKQLYKEIETWHHWVRMSDTVLKCYIVEKPGDKVNLTTGFYIKQGSSGETELHLRKDDWIFISSGNGQYRFQNTSLGDRMDVTWLIKDDQSWQSVISGEGNKEFMNFSRQSNQEIEDLVKLALKNNPDKGTRY